MPDEDADTMIESRAKKAYEEAIRHLAPLIRYFDHSVGLLSGVAATARENGDAVYDEAVMLFEEHIRIRIDQLYETRFHVINTLEGGAERKTSRRHGKVYLAEHFEKRDLKIGHTTKIVEHRVREYSKSRKIDYRPIGSFNGTQQDEQAAHLLFDAFRIPPFRELFRPVPEI